jgi:hypothetical protein
LNVQFLQQHARQSRMKAQQPIGYPPWQLPCHTLSCTRFTVLSALVALLLATWHCITGAAPHRRIPACGLKRRVAISSTHTDRHAHNQHQTTRSNQAQPIVHSITHRWTKQQRSSLNPEMPQPRAFETHEQQITTPPINTCRKHMAHQL